MRLIVARCEVLYTGRLTARLPEAVRLLMFKADGSFLVHDDAGGYRPLNCISDGFPPGSLRRRPSRPPDYRGRTTLRMRPARRFASRQRPAARLCHRPVTVPLNQTASV
jgi:Endonuclease NucS